MWIVNAVAALALGCAFITQQAGEFRFFPDNLTAAEIRLAGALTGGPGDAEDGLTRLFDLVRVRVAKPGTGGAWEDPAPLVSVSVARMMIPGAAKVYMESRGKPDGANTKLYFITGGAQTPTDGYLFWSGGAWNLIVARVNGAGRAPDGSTAAGTAWEIIPRAPALLRKDAPGYVWITYRP